ncbi:hypothetical protein CASFOL_022079 [Castilleja foliolosa]|uniref:Replication factor A C-terminal domain-containing protein n=1 Tax=Castilleja foliolosa TaxID=1961234 RepID=A0ABD3CYF0_9LAMI
MAYSSNTLFSVFNDLHPGSTSWAVKARLIRWYKQPAFQNKQQLGSVEMVIHDQDGVRIHVNIKALLYPKFEGLLCEGQLYTIKNFFVNDNTGSAKTTEHIHKLAFHRGTEMFKFKDDQFPNAMFNFTPLEQLQLHLDIDEFLLRDVIGRVISYEQPFEGYNAKKMDFRIQDTEDHQLSCSLWGDYIDDLLPVLETTKDKPVVVAIQFGKVLKLRDRVLFSSTYHVTKVRVNADADVFTDFMNRLDLNGGNRMLTNTNYSIYEDFTKGKAEVRDLAYLSGLRDDDRYWIDATIIDIDSTRDFWYVACKQCTKKLVAHPGTSTCVTCNQDNSNHNARFKVEVNVLDKSGNATLMLWNKSCEQLIGKSASELKQIYGEQWEPIPKELEDGLIDKRVLFELKLSTYKTVNGRAYCNVSRCAFDDEIMQLYTKMSTGMQDSTSDEHGNLTEESNEDNVGFIQKTVGKGKRRLFIESDEEGVNNEAAKEDDAANDMQSENVAAKSTSSSSDAVYTSKKRQQVMKNGK